METSSSERGKSLPMEERDTNTGSKPSVQGQMFDVFLSHCGKQKDFMSQLNKELENAGVITFFDQDHQSLPLGEPFPSRIFEAAKTCKVAVLLISNDFLEAKWPMLELSTFVQAKATTNPNLKILPLFFQILPNALKNTDEKDQKWQRLGIPSKELGEWQDALNVVRSINGLPFREGDDKVKFREETVKQIWRLLTMSSPKYHVRGMQGEARMCEEVANFLKIQPKKGGVSIAGLYGIAGQGKTTLAKAFCNFYLPEFQGKVCHLEFGRSDSFERLKHALQNLTHPTQWYLQTLRHEDQAKVDLRKRVRGKKVLLVLDNITKESRDEVKYYIEAEFGGNSWILLSGQSREDLKHSLTDGQSCMHVPSLREEDAVKILLEGAIPVESNLNKEDTNSVLSCAQRCSFKEVSFDNARRDRIFHPLALKAFGGYLFSKYGSEVTKWVGEIDVMVDQPGHDLHELFTVLGKALDDMPAKHRTIFMLLTVYILPNISLDKVIEWLAINCNENIPFIKNAIRDLCEKAFIEEFEGEIRVHDLYLMFAQREADKMERWLWRKQDLQYDRRGLISEDNNGFELAKLENCMYETIGNGYLRNLLVLQFVNVHDMSTVDFDPMKRLRSITLRDCQSLKAVKGIEKLRDLAWLQIKGVNPMFKLPDISRIRRLQHLEIDIAGSQVIYQLGDLTNCFRLKEIYVVCPSLKGFPRLKNMKHLEKVEFSWCDKVEGSLDCTDCVNLQTIVLSNCCKMAASPLLSGCEKLENLHLWNMGELMDLPSFERLSELTVLKLGKCGIREPPDLTGCKRLQNVCFFSLRNLKRFPNFSFLSELKKLSLCDCIRVEDPPNIEECQNLEVFHLLYNDNMKGLPKMDKCEQLKEILVSWKSSVDEVTYKGIDPDSLQVIEEIECRLDYWEDEKYGKIGDVIMPEELMEVQCAKGKKILVKRYFRGSKLYYSLTSPYVLPPRMVLKVRMEDEDGKRKALDVLAEVEGVDSVAVDMKENKITVIGDADPVSVTESLSKLGFGLVDLLSVGPANEDKNDLSKDLAELVKIAEKKKEKIPEAQKVEYVVQYLKRMVLKVTIKDEKRKRKALKIVAGVQGVESVAVDMKENKITVIGEADPVSVAGSLRKFGFGTVHLLSVGIAKEEKKDALKDLEELVKKAEKKKEKNPETPNFVFETERETLNSVNGKNPNVTYVYYPPHCESYRGYTTFFSEENPNSCTIS